MILTIMVLDPDAFGDQKKTIGWLEQVYLPEFGFSLRAKMDTGAKNSSIHGIDPEYVERPGKPAGSRIRFKTIDSKGKKQSIEANVLRQVRIKRSSAPIETRREIELEICLAGVRKRVQVNLTDRSEMNYRIILGRTALAGDFIVDVSRKYIAESGCEEE